MGAVVIGGFFGIGCCRIGVGEELCGKNPAFSHMGKGRIFKVLFVDFLGSIEILVFLCNGLFSGREHQVDTGVITYFVFRIYGGMVLVTEACGKIPVYCVVLHIGAGIRIMEYTIPIH
jgi:hypothetical protein